MGEGAGEGFDFAGAQRLYGGGVGGVDTLDGEAQQIGLAALQVLLERLAFLRFPEEAVRQHVARRPDVLRGGLVDALRRDRGDRR